MIIANRVKQSPLTASIELSSRSWTAANSLLIHISAWHLTPFRMTKHICLEVVTPTSSSHYGGLTCEMTRQILTIPTVISLLRQTARVCILGMASSLVLDDSSPVNWSRWYWSISCSGMISSILMVRGDPRTITLMRILHRIQKRESLYGDVTRLPTRRPSEVSLSRIASSTRVNNHWSNS